MWRYIIDRNRTQVEGLALPWFLPLWLAQFGARIRGRYVAKGLQVQVLVQKNK